MRHLATACLVASAVILAPAASPASPPDAASYAWRTTLGAHTPLETPLRDEAGRTIRFADAIGGRPVILDLGYFHCPSLCGTVRADLLNALSGSGLVDKRDYSLVSLSIDPAETPKDAAQAKAADLAQAPFASGAGWHYLTGTAGAVAAIESAVGFRDRYDDQLRQFLHPAGLVVLTKTGVVSGYLLGVGYTSGDLRAAVLRAGDDSIAQAVLPVLLLCFHFDETTGRYTLAIEKVLRLMALLTVVTLGGLMIVLHRHRPKRSP